MLITEGAPDATLASAVSTDARFEFLRTVFNQEENDRYVHRGGCPMGVALGHGGNMGPDAAILTRYLQQIRDVFYSSVLMLVLSCDSPCFWTLRWQGDMAVVMQPAPKDAGASFISCRGSIEVWIAMGLSALVGGLLTPLILMAARRGEKVQKVPMPDQI